MLLELDSLAGISVSICSLAASYSDCAAFNFKRIVALIHSSNNLSLRYFISFIYKTFEITPGSLNDNLTTSVDTTFPLTVNPIRIFRGSYCLCINLFNCFFPCTVSSFLLHNLLSLNKR